MDNILNISKASTQYIYLSTEIDETDIEDINDLQVESCMLELGEDIANADWVSAEWAGEVNNRTIALLLDGQSMESDTGYRQIARITSNPEIPIIYGDDVVSFY